MPSLKRGQLTFTKLAPGSATGRRRPSRRGNLYWEPGVCSKHSCQAVPQRHVGCRALCNRETRQIQAVAITECAADHLEQGLAESATLVLKGPPDRANWRRHQTPTAHPAVGGLKPEPRPQKEAGWRIGRRNGAQGCHRSRGHARCRLTALARSGVPGIAAGAKGSLRELHANS